MKVTEPGTHGLGGLGHRAGHPPLSQPQEGSCGPGNPEQLGLGPLTDLRLGLGTLELDGWNGSLDPCLTQEA